jgi:hypothetical protein
MFQATNGLLQDKFTHFLNQTLVVSNNNESNSSTNIYYKNKFILNGDMLIIDCLSTCELKKFSAKFGTV